MNKLGYVNQPEQFARAGDDCIIADSLTARQFFKLRINADGVIFLGALYYASTQDRFMPVWFLVDTKTTKILSATPIFKVENFDFYAGAQVIKTKVVEHDTYFYWKNQLYAVVFTSTGEMIIRKMRCILSASDMFNIACLDDDMEVERCFPVKLYDQNNGHFLAVCWQMEGPETYWFETVCADDDARLAKIKASETVAYPISIGDKAIIGSDYYTCCYDKVFDLYFKKMPFKASDKDRAAEDIPLKNPPSPKIPQLKVAFSRDKEESEAKKKKEEKMTSKIVALTPKH